VLDYNREGFNLGKGECDGVLNLVKVAEEVFAGRKIAGEA
jgi:hypothetical protein